MMYSRDECIASNQTWERSELNFDHVGKSVVSLAYVGKRNFWKFIFYDYANVKTRQVIYINQCQ